MVAHRVRKVVGAEVNEVRSMVIGYYSKWISIIEC
jgi:hypothetical protein